MKVHIYTTNVISRGIFTAKMFFACICYALKTPWVGLGGRGVGSFCILYAIKCVSYAPEKCIYTQKLFLAYKWHEKWHFHEIGLDKTAHFVYIEKVLDLGVQLMKNGGKTKTVEFIILFSDIRMVLCKSLCHASIYAPINGSFCHMSWRRFHSSFGLSLSLFLFSVSSCDHRRTQWCLDQISMWSIYTGCWLFVDTKISLDYRRTQAQNEPLV